MKYAYRLITLILILVVALGISANAAKWTTGLQDPMDSGYFGHDFYIDASPSNPSNASPAELHIITGLYSGGPTDVDVFFNGNLLESFSVNVDSAYEIHPLNKNFNITGMFTDNPNRIRFITSESASDVAIGEASITYEYNRTAVPEPSSVALMIGAGAFGILGAVKRKIFG